MTEEAQLIKMSIKQPTPIHPPSRVVSGSTDGFVSPVSSVDSPPGWAAASPVKNPEPLNVITYDICGTKNPVGSRVCSRCYAPLD